MPGGMKGVRMPQPRKPASLPLKRLARLPRHPGTTIVGGRRALQAEVQDGKDRIHPQVVVWMEEESQMMLGTGIVALERSADEGVTEAIEMLVQGLVDAADEGAGLPGKIVVTDAALVPGLEASFAPYQVAVEQVESLPLLDRMFAYLLESLGFTAEGEPPPPFAWDLPENALAPLYVAAARLWRRAPWSYLLDHPTIAVSLGEHGPAPGIDTLHASILGAAGTVYGVACYTSVEAFEAAAHAGIDLAEHENDLLDEALDFLREHGLPVDQIPQEIVRQMVAPILEKTIDEEGDFDPIHQDALVCYFDDREEIDPTYLSWMQDHNLKPPSRHGVPTFLRTLPEGEPRVLDECEARALTLAIEAICQFCSHFRSRLESEAPAEEPMRLRARIGQIAVNVSYTPDAEEDFPAGE
jgi:hypothetical protein